MQEVLVYWTGASALHSAIVGLTELYIRQNVSLKYCTSVILFCEKENRRERIDTTAVRQFRDIYLLLDRC